MRRILVLAAALALAGAFAIPTLAAKPLAHLCHGHSCPSPSPAPTPYAGPKLLFGIGPEADSAINDQLVADAPVKMLTSWFNSHNDLSWMGGWHQSVLNWYAQGFTLHLVIYDTSADVPDLTTPYGPACGKSYALSSTAVDDASALAAVFAGGPYYVTVFTEFQTNPCLDNQWVGNENYFRSLQDNYLRIVSAFHATGGKVSLGWGGWQSRWDDPANGGGLSLFPYFASVMNVSDFQSFQAMQTDTNVTDIQNMTSILHGYGPVMLAHYLPNGAICSTYSADVHALFTDSAIADLSVRGMFAWSFMGTDCLSDSTLYAFVRDAVRRYGVP